MKSQIKVILQPARVIDSGGLHSKTRVPMAWLAWAIWLLVAAACNFESLAAPVGIDNARTAVTNWIAREPRPLDTKIGSHVRSAETINDISGNPLYHVVYLSESGTATSGYVIVGANDLSEPIVAFCAGDRFDSNPGSPLAAILAHELSHRVAAAKKAIEAMGPGASRAIIPSPALKKQYAATVAAKVKWGKLLADGPSLLMGADSFPTVPDIRVAPLVQTKWSQSTASGSACYNYYTPGPGGWTPGLKTNYVCGCVATGMAQVIRYFQWPTVGIGTAVCPIQINDVYTSGTLRGGDGKGGPYQYTVTGGSGMPLNPQTAGITTSQLQMIGSLTADAGVAVGMDYDTGGSGESGAYINSSALRNTFKYSNAIWGNNNGNDIGAPLEAMVNPNLDAACPVIFGISDMAGDGHCVVCDGYGFDLGTEYHHVNLGWAGQDDAWYDLPEIDATPYDFVFLTDCVYNIFPVGSGEIVSGRVTDKGGGPISGVVVSGASYGAVVCTATTGSNGIYALATVPSAATYVVTATASSYTFSSQGVSVGISSQDGDQCGNVWGVNFVAASGTGSGPNFYSSAATVQLGDGGTANLGSTLCKIQAALDATITVTIAAIGGATSYSATGLPPGLTIDPITGTMSGQLTQAGTFPAIITAYNASGQGSGTLTFNVIAGFLPTLYTVSTSSSPVGAGKTTAACTYTLGATAVVSATANSGYIFNNWAEGGSVITTSPTYSFLVSGDATLVANFTPLPTATTGPASGTLYNSATLTGAVNPNGAAATWYFNYGLTSTYGSMTGVQPAGSGVAAAPVNAAITGLAAGTAYHYQLVAANSNGTTYGSDQSFITADPPPVATTGDATGTTFDTAVINGAINPNGLNTTYFFNYGVDSSYGNVTVSQPAGNGAVTTPVYAAVQGLNYSTTYHYQLVAANSSGTTYGIDETFTTAKLPPPPVVITGSATGTTYDATMVNGTINPNGVDTTYYFQFGPDATYGNTTPSQAAGTGTSASNFSGSITGLTFATTYHYQIVASSVSGMSYGADQTFTTVSIPPPPVVITGSAAVSSYSAVTVSGTVNSYGAVATCYVQYGLDTFYGSVTGGQDAGNGTVAAPVNVDMTGLTGATVYHYRVVAATIGGTGYGLDQTFTTANNPPPSILTGTAIETTFQDAILNGTVNPNGLATSVYFESGTSTVYGSTTSTQEIVAGTSPLPYSAQLASLNSGTLYHYRLVGINRSGTAYGTDQTFIRSPSSNADLTALQLGAGALSPVFTESGTAYFVNVANSVASTTLTAMTATNATMQLVSRGASKVLKSGSATGELKLQMGVNMFDVVVTAPDSSTIETYSISVNRTALPGRVVAAQSGTAAGLADTKFVGFGNPAINDRGDQAFQAVVSVAAPKVTKYSAIFVETGSSGATTEIANTLSAAPDQSGNLGGTGNFAVLGDPLLNNNGEIAFLGTLQSSGPARVTAANCQGIWANSTGMLHLIARQGQTLHSGAKLASLCQLVLPDSGGPVFLADLAIGPGKVTAKNNEGIFGIGSDGALEELVGTGQLLAGGTIASLSIFATPTCGPGQTRSFDSAGDLIFNATLTSGSQGVYILMADGSVSTVATKNEGVPTTGASTGGFFSALCSPIINNLSHAAFYAMLSGGGISGANNAGIWAETGTGNEAILAGVARAGDGAPNASGSTGALASGIFSSIGTPVYNDSDQIAFIGTLKTSGTVTKLNNQGIWLWTGSTGMLTQLARTQQPAAKCGGAEFASFIELALPDSGGVIVMATITGTGVTTANNQGIWVMGAGGQSTLVARKGYALVVDAQNTTKTIGALSIFGATAGVGGQTRSFNKAGELIYKVTFTDGSQAIYQVPPP